MPQDVFKESRSHDQMDAKNDTETQFRSRKLPLTRKIYAFYRAPIVKFWSNTVGRLKSMSNHLLWLFIREELSVIGTTHWEGVRHLFFVSRRMT